MIWFGWLGFTILGKTPRGAPPAWDGRRGDAVAEGRASSRPRPAAAAEAPVEGDATEVFAEAEPQDHSGAPRARPQEEAQAARVNIAVPPRAGFRYGGSPPVGADAERLLAAPTELLLGARERNPALAALDLERELATLEHEWAPYRGDAIHLELHGADPAAPTVVVAPGSATTAAGISGSPPRSRATASTR